MKPLWVRLIFPAMLCIGGVGTGVAAKKPVVPTLKDIRGREVTLDTAAPVDVSPEDVIKQYERVLELGSTDPRLRAEALRRLGDLKLEVDETARGADAAALADPARLREAIGIYESLVRNYPESGRNDMVLYQLARAYEADSRTPEALGTLDRLVRDYPLSKRIAEAQFRKGEIHFSAGRYADAQRAYAALIALGPDSAFYEQGLYKQGWSLFKQSLSDESSAAFLTLLDRVLARTGVLRSRTELTRPEQELTEDTFRALAVTFADLDGPATLDGAIRARGMPVYGHLLYDSLGNLYIEKGRFQDAAQAYAAFVRQKPDDLNAPILQLRAIEAYQKGGFESLVLKGKEDFVDRYALTSNFWASRSPADAPDVVAILKSNLKDLAQYHHAKAQKTKQSDDFVAAARWYGAMLQSFPMDAEAPNNRYLLAEVLFEGGQYAEAAREYARTAYDYPIHIRSAEAGYASLVSYQKQEVRLEGAEKAAWHRQLIDNELMFANTFVEHQEAGPVLTKAAEDLFALNEFDRTIEVAQQVLQKQPGVDARRQRTAATLLAHSLFERERFAEAEQAYLKVQSLLPAGDPDQSVTVERLAASIYKQAEAKQAAGTAESAVDDFLRVAVLAPTSKVRANAEFDAASLLMQEKQWGRAVEVLVAFRGAHPAHEFEPEVTKSLAVAYLESGRALDAASEFQKIAARPTETREVRRAALWQAADLYEKSKSLAPAAATFAAYVEQFPQPFDAAMDARQRLADIAQANHDDRLRLRVLQDIVRADQSAGAARNDRSRYLAARATLVLVEPEVASFNSIRLAVPLAKSLKAKRTAMERVLSAYGKALDYQVAEVTTAATFGMAEAYRQLGSDLLVSERPKDLDADAREQYDVLLEEQAFPFEEKAIELYQANVKRTGEGVYDVWVQRSFETLAKLMPARFAKSERSEDYVPELR
jgi:tetratricopeptide (TPR) repeat protein